MSSDKKTWYAIYTKPRWEKKVHDLMLRRGLESYCPLNKVRKKWSDRFKIIEEPLFKSYVFVKVSEDEKPGVRYIDGVVNFVYWLGKPARVHEEEIERIKRFLNDHTDVQIESLNSIKPGDRVVINSGVFMDHEGVVLHADRRTVELHIQSLGAKLVAHIDKEKLNKIN
ncbi:UpxY family transcription antiterminator [Flavihumibacter solisilvae]|uniref:Antitermination protein NusG n=1 Tax=Flavihumibacter solisilvae TaxID=1349421 RepID=A0A0C1IW30_9BACT|nr:UpxY family transcription antiterminator [Flavihumibacter solisilvae]KIC94689.1 antitermination protein NusG [Flavihumibacter solisilvae]